MALRCRTRGSAFAVEASFLVISVAFRFSLHTPPTFSLYRSLSSSQYVPVHENAISVSFFTLIAGFIARVMCTM